MVIHLKFDSYFSLSCLLSMLNISQLNYSAMSQHKEAFYFCLIHMKCKMCVCCLWSYRKTSSVRINVIWLGSRQKTTPSLTDFRCWPPTSEGPNPSHYHHHQVCIAYNSSSSLDDVLVLLNTLTALRLKVSQKHMTSASHMTSTPMILHALGLNLSTSYQTSTHLFWLSCFGRCKTKQARKRYQRWR